MNEASQFSVKLGRRIRGMRQTQGLKLADVARQLNVTHQAVAKWETGISIPPLPVFLRLTNALNTTVGQMVEGLPS